MIKMKKVVFSNTSYVIKPINRKAANDYLEVHHYAHNRPVSMFHLGAYTNNVLIGVISYGQSAAPKLHTSLISYLQRDEYFELIRLHVQDVTEKNFESWFIAESFKWIKEFYPNIKLLVSFADPSEDHTGTIYQATNWEYCGTSNPANFYRNTSTGKLEHPRSVTKWRKNGDHHKLEHLIPEKRPGKYRYVYFLQKTTTFYKDIDEDKLVTKSDADYLLDLEYVYQRPLVERHGDYLKKYNRYLKDDFKLTILDYPK